MFAFYIRNVNTGLKFDLKIGEQILLTSEVYSCEAVCRKGIESVKKNSLVNKLEDTTIEGFVKLTNPKFEIYSDKSGAYRFRLHARNGETIAVSKSFSEKADCLECLKTVQLLSKDAKIISSI